MLCNLALDCCVVQLSVGSVQLSVGSWCCVPPIYKLPGNINAIYIFFLTMTRSSDACISARRGANSSFGLLILADDEMLTLNTTRLVAKYLVREEEPARFHLRQVRWRKWTHDHQSLAMVYGLTLNDVGTREILAWTTCEECHMRNSRGAFRGASEKGLISYTTGPWELPSNWSEIDIVSQQETTSFGITTQLYCMTPNNL